MIVNVLESDYLPQYPVRFFFFRHSLLLLTLAIPQSLTKIYLNEI